MVHSIELLFDRDTEAAIGRIWDDLAAADIPGRAPAGRPHVTVAVAERIAPDVDALLRPVAQRLPLGCTVGAPLLFGRSNAVLARLDRADGGVACVARRGAPSLRPVPGSRSAAEQPARPMDGARDGGPPSWGTPTRAGLPSGGSTVRDSRHRGWSAPLGRHQPRRAPDQLSYRPLLPGLAPLPAVYEALPVPASPPPATIRYSSRMGLSAKKSSRISRVPAA
jgi:hypothetical protein